VYIWQYGTVFWEYQFNKNALLQTVSLPIFSHWDPNRHMTLKRRCLDVVTTSRQNHKKVVLTSRDRFGSSILCKCLKTKGDKRTRGSSVIISILTINTKTNKQTKNIYGGAHNSIDRLIRWSMLLSHADAQFTRKSSYKCSKFDSLFFIFWKWFLIRYYPFFPPWDSRGILLNVELNRSYGEFSLYMELSFFLFILLFVCFK